MASRRLERKIQPALVPLFAVGVPILLIGLYMTIFITVQYNIALMIVIVGGGGLLYLFLMDRGYQLFWDEEKFQVRSWVWRSFMHRNALRSIAYDEVADLRGCFYGNDQLKRHFMPFEYISVSKNDSEDEEDILIYPPAFRYDYEVKEFLRFFHDKRPELFSSEIVEYIHSDKPL